MVLLTREGIASDVSIIGLAAATSRIVSWSAGGTGPLLHAVHDAFGMLAPPPTAVLDAHEPALKRWLAARLFGNWVAYQGDGLQPIVSSLRGCLATFTTELARDGSPLAAIRPSDPLILHKA